MLRLKKKMSPELVNRFDSIILFNNFSDQDFLNIISIELTKVRKKLKEKDIHITFSPTIKKEILRRTILEKLEADLLEGLFKMKLKFVLPNLL